MLVGLVDVVENDKDAVIDVKTEFVGSDLVHLEPELLHVDFKDFAPMEFVIKGILMANNSFSVKHLAAAATASKSSCRL